MNETIREFAVEAGLAQIYNGTEYPKLRGKFFPNLSGPTTEGLEKFAQLIVQECARHMVTRSTHIDTAYCATQVADHYHLVYASAKYTIALELRELFGVEDEQSN